MELILLQKIRNLGNLGDKVKVKPGYGRNYLVPQGKALPASAANLAAFESRRDEYEARASQQLAGASARSEQFADAAITIKANASLEGKLFGSVGARDIADAFTHAGKALDKSEVLLPEGPIRHTGEYEVEVHLHADVNVKVKVTVEAES